MKILLICLLPLALFGKSVEERLQEMTLEEKIGQLFILPACPLGDEKHEKNLISIIQTYGIGGVIPKASDICTHIQFIKNLQERSVQPLLVVADAEWGLGMRITDGISFPRNMTLGAVQEDELLFQLGKIIGKECRSAGIHINLAPVMDVNSNPFNPIIHMRSFGENPQAVAQKGLKIMQGMQEMGILAAAKHFPGHGDTSMDSHVDLPLIAHPLERLDLIELYPFGKMIEGGVSAIMSSHLLIPALEERMPATFSVNAIRHLLREKLNFQGLVISDALNMKALSLYYTPGEIAKLCFQSGHDLLLYGDHIAPNIDKILNVDFPEAFQALKEAFVKGELSVEELDQRVKRIIEAKEKLHLFEERIHDNMSDINTDEAKELKSLLFEKAVTLVKNDQVLPLKWRSNTFFLTLNASNPNLPNIDLAKVGQVVFLLKGLKNNLPKYGIADPVIQFIQEAKEKCKTCLVLFGTPYALSYVSADAILVLYEEVENQLAFDFLYGKKNPSGKLPVSTGKFSAGTGLHY